MSTPAQNAAVTHPISQDFGVSIALYGPIMSYETGFMSWEMMMLLRHVL
jgi:hypothetical protein